MSAEGETVSLFSEEKLLKRLSSLSSSQNSIQGVSHWIVYNRDHGAEIVATWFKEYLRAPPPRQLLFLYVANDAMQTCLRKFGPTLSELFGTVLKDCIAVTVKSNESRTIAQVERLLQVWKERQVLSADALAQIEAVIPKQSEPTPTAKHTPKATTPHKRERPRESVDSITPRSIMDEKDELQEDISKALADFEPSERTTDLQHVLEGLLMGAVTNDLAADRFARISAVMKGKAAETEYNWEDMTDDLVLLDVEESRSTIEKYREVLDTQNTRRENLLQKIELLLEDPPSKDSVDTWQESVDDAEKHVELLKLMKTLARAAVREEERLEKDGPNPSPSPRDSIDSQGQDIASKRQRVGESYNAQPVNGYTSQGLMNTGPGISQPQNPSPSKLSTSLAGSFEGRTSQAPAAEQTNGSRAISGVSRPSPMGVRTNHPHFQQPHAPPSSMPQPTPAFNSHPNQQRPPHNLSQHTPRPGPAYNHGPHGFQVPAARGPMWPEPRGAIRVLQTNGQAGVQYRAQDYRPNIAASPNSLPQYSPRTTAILSPQVSGQLPRGAPFPSPTNAYHPVPSPPAARPPQQYYVHPGAPPRPTQSSMQHQAPSPRPPYQGGPPMHQAVSPAQGWNGMPHPSQPPQGRVYVAHGGGQQMQQPQWPPPPRYRQGR